MASGDCSKKRGQIALLAGGELSQGRSERLRSHLKACSGCRELHGELRSLGGLARLTLQSSPAEEGGFSSVRGQVRSRLIAAAPATPAVRTPLWTVLAPVAGVLAMAGFLLLIGPAREAGFSGPELPEAYPALSVSSVEDAGGVVFAINDGDHEIYRLAVSSRSSDFEEAQVFEVQGGTWLDPTPAPRPGQVLYYRVD
jgi:hypothetical protein